MYMYCIQVTCTHQISPFGSLHSLKGIDELWEVSQEGYSLLQEPHGVKIPDGRQTNSGTDVIGTLQIRIPLTES